MEAGDVHLLLCDRNRRRILELVLAGSPTVTDLVRATRLHQPLVSHHLRALRAAGLVVGVREGRFRRYKASSAEVAKLLKDLEKAAAAVGKAGAQAVDAAPGGKSAPATKARK
jgi:ArsR family transcriptional regulator, zinc-responsive transcriptional repressor